MINQLAEKHIGIDVGTTGVRAICIDAQNVVAHSSIVSFNEFKGARNDPKIWLAAVSHVISEICRHVQTNSIAAIAIDGTSGTMTVTDASGTPLAKANMYNEVCEDNSILEQIATRAPAASAAHGASSGLAKAIQFSRIDRAAWIQHEADWIAFALSGKNGLTDENNALKTGYDPVSEQWPEWIAQTSMNTRLLPKVLRAGQPIGPAVGTLAKNLNLAESTLIVAGTTDGCASFLATGAAEAGDGVTILGSTVTLKVLSEAPIFAPHYGIYSHKIGNAWLAGGASNTGGNVLAHYFSDSQLLELSSKINPFESTGLDYYPLVKTGERFPINDKAFKPKLEPRPESDVDFLHGLLNGIARIEKLGYQRLEELGAPALKSLRTVGGGAKNNTWTHLRRKALTVPFADSISNEAAMGTALLAKRGADEARARSTS